MNGKRKGKKEGWSEGKKERRKEGGKGGGKAKETLIAETLTQKRRGRHKWKPVEFQPAGRSI